MVSSQSLDRASFFLAPELGTFTHGQSKLAQICACLSHSSHPS